MKSLVVAVVFITYSISAKAQVNERVTVYLNYVGCSNDSVCYVNLVNNPNNCGNGNIYFPLSSALGKSWHATALTAFSMRKKLSVVFVKGANGLCGDVKDMHVMD